MRFVVSYYVSGSIRAGRQYCVLNMGEYYYPARKPDTSSNVTK